jgi:hypothetical protein
MPRKPYWRAAKEVSIIRPKRRPRPGHDRSEFYYSRYIATIAKLRLMQKAAKAYDNVLYHSPLRAPRT